MAAEFKKQLKIAMLGHKRIPSREGGVEVVVGETSTLMHQKGHIVTCYNRKSPPLQGESKKSTPTLKHYNGVRLKTAPTINKRGLAAMTSSVFATIKAAFGKYDIVHFHAEGSCALIWLPKLLRKKCVVTIHGLDHKRAKWGKFAAWYILFGEKCAVRFADEIIVLSENLQKYFTDTYGRKTVLIPNGVTRPQITRAEQITESFGIKKDDYILFLGRLVPEKGIKYLIAAFSQIKTEKKLVIAGGSSDTDDYESELKAMAQADSRVIFTGFVQGQLHSELYSNAYVYVLPSDLEGMPLSLLEAMSYGNCCVTSDIPECAEVMDEFGITFEQGNVQKLQKVLQELCDNPQTVELFKAQAADYICGKYNWDDVTNRTLKLYGAEQEIDYYAPTGGEKIESTVSK
ncbi:MAG: glycosyltransferase family 4 protein [Oscillospiraceae bacterium]|jgi:glycosyltransferase involved in cell wall biosynthesis|nr:glycosyltransferase family 4 protein [Oscillospiraceae bacterium]